MPRTAHKPAAIDQQGFGVIGTLINLIFGIIVSLVALRFLFTLFGANQLNGFVSWVYTASQPFVAPFSGIFQDLSVFGGRIEMATLVALVVYGLVAGILSRIMAGGRYHSHPA